MTSSLVKKEFIWAHSFKYILVHHCGKDLELIVEKKDEEVAPILADQEAGSVTGRSQR